MDPRKALRLSFPIFSFYPRSVCWPCCYSLSKCPFWIRCGMYPPWYKVDIYKCYIFHIGTWCLKGTWEYEVPQRQPKQKSPKFTKLFKKESCEWKRNIIITMWLEKSLNRTVSLHILLSFSKQYGLTPWHVESQRVQGRLMEPQNMSIYRGHKGKEKWLGPRAAGRRVKESH